MFLRLEESGISLSGAEKEELPLELPDFPKWEKQTNLQRNFEHKDSIIEHVEVPEAGEAT